jgi:AraC-like DNA-binding protein
MDWTLPLRPKKGMAMIVTQTNLAEAMRPRPRRPRTGISDQYIFGQNLTDSQDPLSMLLICAQKDLNRLNNILSYAEHKIFLSSENGVLIDRRGDLNEGWEPEGHDAQSGVLQDAHFEAIGRRGGEQADRAHGYALPIHWRPPGSIRGLQRNWATAPIFGPDGNLVARLGVEWIAQSQPGRRPDATSRAVIQATVRAIEERLFRERYRQEWIVAVTPQEFRNSVMLFAVNRDKRIVGADRYGRMLLSNHDLSSERAPAESSLSFWALFQNDSAPFRFSHGGDIHAPLVPIGTTEVWSCLVTPPEGAATASRNPDAYLHVRPRIQSLGSVRPVTSTPRARGGLSPSVFRRVCQHIDADLQSDIDVRTLSDIAGLSIWHFGRAFKQSLGATPHRYLMHRRLEKARHLVADTNLPLAEIAIGAGFSDQSHFGRRFTQYFGLSPGAFRRSQR